MNYNIFEPLSISLDIYDAGPYYDHKRNVVRAKKEQYIVDVLLDASNAIIPDPNIHKVIIRIPSESALRAANIRDPERISIGNSQIQYAILGTLVDLRQHPKIGTTTGMQSMIVGGKSGSGDPNSISFALTGPIYDEEAEISSHPIENTTIGSTNNSTDYATVDQRKLLDRLDMTKVNGIFKGRDGTITIRGPGGDITIGLNGILISGTVHNERQIKSDSMIMKTNPFSGWIPETVVTFPVALKNIPNIDQLVEVANIIQNAAGLVEKVKAIHDLAQAVT